jgi:hypothetical protein
MYCSIQRQLHKLEREEEEARLNFIASLKPSTAAAILGNNAADSGVSVIFKVQEVTGGGNVD